MGCAKGICGIFHDGKPMDAPTSPGTSSRFSLRAFDLCQKSTFCFSALPGHKKKDFGKESPFPVDQLWQGIEGGHSDVPEFRSPPALPSHFPQNRDVQEWGKPLLEQPHDPTTRKSQELPRPRGFPAFPALPRPPSEQRENYNPLLLNSTRALK